MSINRVHILPENDILMHDEVGEHCHCNPKVEHHGNGIVVIHNAFDGRGFCDDDIRSVKQ